MGWWFRFRHALHERFQDNDCLIAVKVAEQQRETFGNWSWTTPARNYRPTECVSPREERHTAEVTTASVDGAWDNLEAAKHPANAKCVSRFNARPRNHQPNIHFTRAGQVLRFNLIARKTRKGGGTVNFRHSSRQE